MNPKIAEVLNRAAEENAQFVLSVEDATKIFEHIDACENLCKRVTAELLKALDERDAARAACVEKQKDLDAFIGQAEREKARLHQDLEHTLKALTSVQTRCTELLNETRAQRAELVELRAWKEEATRRFAKMALSAHAATEALTEQLALAQRRARAWKRLAKHLHWTLRGAAPGWYAGSRRPKEPRKMCSCSCDTCAEGCTSGAW